MCNCCVIIMSEKWRQIRCNKINLDKLRNEIKQEFLKHHPEFEGYPLSDNFLLTKIINYYLESDY